MRLLLPLDALPEGGVETADAAGNDRGGEEFDGWPSLRFADPPRADYAQTGFTADAFVACVSGLLPQVSRFVATATSGFEPDATDSYGVYDDDPLCFGFGAECYLKAERNGGLVTILWFGAPRGEPEKLAALRAAIEAVDGRVPSVVVDHFLDMSGRVRDTRFMDRYFAVLDERA